MNERYYSSKDAALKLGVCRKTLQNWANDGKINYIRTEGGWRKYDVDSYLNIIDGEIIKREKVCYCRVSSYDQKEDLERQELYLRTKYPNHTIIKDIGSGINFKRKGLLKILDMGINNELDELILTYKDRLCRIGFDMIEYIFNKYSNTKIIIENIEETTVEQGITNDLIEIITVYSSKLYGRRSHR